MQDVKRRKQSGEVLPENEENFRLLVEQAPVGVFIHAGLKFVYLNPMALQLFGAKNSQELIGKPLFDRIHPHFHKTVRQRINKISRQKISLPPIEEVYLKMDGTPFDLEARAVPIRWQGTDAVMVFFRDITEQRQMQQALARSEEKYRFLFEQAPLAYQILTPEGIITNINRRWSELLGYTREEVLGKSIFSFMLEEERDSARASFMKKQTQKATFREARDRRYRSKSGEVKIVTAHDFFVGIEQGQITAVQTALVDVTEQRKSEQERIALEDRYHELFNNMHAGVAVYEAVDQGNDFVFKDFNAAAEAIERTPRASVLGRRVTEVFPGIRDMHLLEVFKRVWKTGTPEGHPAVIYQDDHLAGWRENFVYRLPSGEVVAVYEDVTEQKKLETERRESEERFRSLFEYSPVALWEEDFSAVKPRLDALRARGVADFDAWFKDHPQEVAECAALVKVVDVNQAGMKLYKAKRKKDLFMNLPKILIPDEGHKFAKELACYARGITRFSWEGINRTLTGETLILSLTAFVAPGHEHDLSRVIVAVNDVTGQKQAEAALRESEERYRILFEDSPVSLWEEDFSAVKLRLDQLHAQGVKDFSAWFASHPKEVARCAELVRIVDVNQAGIDLYKAKDKRELLGYLSNILSPDAISGFEKELAAYAQGRTRFSWEGANRTLSGERINILISSFVAPGHENDLTRLVKSITDITERKRMEDELRLSEEKFSNAFHVSPDAININRLSDGLYIDVNDGFCDLTGFKPEEVIGKTSLELNIWADPKDRQKLIDRLQEQGEVKNLEAPFRTKNGEIKICLMSARVIEFNRETCILSITRDITNRKRMEDALRVSEERFRVVQEMSPDGFTILHPLKNEQGEIVDFTWIYENQAIARLNGTDPQGVKGKRLLDLFPTHKGTPLFDAYVHAAATGKPRIIEEIYVGEIISKPTWLRLVVVPMGVDIAILSQDISEQKRLRGELQESEQKFRSVFESSNAGKSFTALTGEITVNKAYADMLGFTVEELKGKTWQQLTPPEDIEATQVRLAPILEGKSDAARFEKRYLHKDGSMVWADFSTAIRRAPDGRPLHFITTIVDITQRKRAEDALRKSESMFKKVFEILPIGLWIADKNGKLLQGNPAGVKIWGKEPKVSQSEYGLFKARRLPSGEEIAPDDWALAHTVNEGVTVADELLEIETFDGKKKIILNYTAPLLDSDGEVEGAIVVNQDITERKKAELELIESEERFRQVFEAANVGKSITFLTGELSVNQAYADMLGYTVEELKSIHWHKLTPPEDIAAVQAHLDSMLKGKCDSVRYEKGYICKDGSLLWADVGTALQRAPNGAPMYFITTMVDITERRRAEQAEQALMQRIEAGLRAGNLAWWEMELPSGKVLFDDRKAQMLGFPSKKFKTYADFTRLLHPDDYPVAMQAMQDHLDGKADAYEVEYRIKTRAGAYRWFRDIGALTDSDPLTGTKKVIGIVEEITNRKEAELAIEAYSSQLEDMVAERTRALVAAQQELLVKEKLATLGQLAGSVGHELRNPLGVINNAVFILERTIPLDNQKAHEYAQMISVQVQRSNKIITDLLNFAREPGTNRSAVSAHEMIKQALRNSPPPENIQIKQHLEKDLPDVVVDSQQIEQVLINLITNACQAMPDGGSLSIFAGQVKDGIHISVKDSGTGISAENLKKLFEPLFTTKARGIGLGLATSKKLVEANGGRIIVKSKPGEGSCFKLVLPVSGEKNGK